MVVPAARARSLSSRRSSHCSLEAELEGAILQQTASVDYYLQTAAPIWTASSCSAAECVTRQELQALFLSDLGASLWQMPTHGQSEISCYESSLQPAKVHSGLLPPMPSASQQRGPILYVPTRKPRQQSEPGASSQLERFLLDDARRLLHLQEQLAEEAAASDAAVLATSPEERRRRASSGSNSSISFVRLPDLGAEEDEGPDDGDAHAHHVVAVALAAATAIAAADSLAASPGSPSTALRSSMSNTALAAATAAAAAPDVQPLQLQHLEGQAAGVGLSEQQHQQPEASARPSAPPAAHEMEADEDIAAQKAAARTRLAELQQQDAASHAAAAGGAAAIHSAVAPQAASSGGGKKGDADEDDAWARGGAADEAGHAAGSLHSSIVPERPRGLAGKVMQHAQPLTLRAALGALLDRLLGMQEEQHHPLAFASAGGALQQHDGFLHAMRVGVLLCVLLLPVLWLMQSAGPAGSGLVRSMLRPEVAARAEQLFNGVYVAGAAGGLLFLLLRSLVLQPPVLQFACAQLEGRYLLWSNASRVATDCLLQGVSVLAGCCLWQALRADAAASGDDPSSRALASADGVRLLLSCASLMGSGLPVLTLLLMRSGRYVRWREQLLAGSRLCCTLGLTAVQLALPVAAGGGFQQLQLSMPLVALAQLMSIACMQVRLSTFVPFQALQLLVLLARTKATNPLLHLVQLFGSGLCLPCLLLHRMELHSRRAFLAACGAPATSQLRGTKAV